MSALSQLEDIEMFLSDVLEDDDLLLQHVKDIRAELRKGANDTSLLDWVEKQSNGDPWIARESDRGRGYRVHNSVHGCHVTARSAIAAARK